ncbi:hypothetical protein N9L68_01840 [bacterium]|nr:hypothetical protein [bacterium]
MLTRTGPKQLEMIYFQERRRQEITRALWQVLPEWQDGEEAGNIHRGAPMWTEPVRAAYRALHGGRLRVVLAQAVAGTSSIERQEPNPCDDCPHTTDGVHHKAYFSEFTRPLWDKLPSQLLQQARQDPQDLWFLKAWTAEPPNPKAAATQISFRRWVVANVPPDLNVAGIRIYTDGLVYDQRIRASAGWAWIAVGPDDTLLGGQAGTLGSDIGLPRTSGGTEHVAMGKVQEVMREQRVQGPIPVKADNKGAVRNATAKRDEAAQPHKSYAQCWIKGSRLQAQWVKAHRALQGDEAGEDQQDIFSNSLVDLLAKAVAGAEQMTSQLWKYWKDRYRDY